MHSKFEDKQKVYDGDSNLQSIKSFMTANVHGLCGHRTGGNSGEFDKKPLVVVYYDVDYVKNVKGTNYWRNRCVIKVIFFEIPDFALFMLITCRKYTKWDIMFASSV